METAVQGGGSDVVDLGVATNVFEHVHVLAQWEAAQLLIEPHGVGQAGKQAKGEEKEDTHAAPQWQPDRVRESHLLDRRAIQGQIV
ncbi:hypothetical protein D3C78_1574290 [compost metagenome]